VLVVNKAATIVLYTQRGGGVGVGAGVVLDAVGVHGKEDQVVVLLVEADLLPAKCVALAQINDP